MAPLADEPVDAVEEPRGRAPGPVEDHHVVDAEVPQRRRHRETGRTGADDDHVGAGRGHGLPHRERRLGVTRPGPVAG